MISNSISHGSVELEYSIFTAAAVNCEDVGKFLPHDSDDIRVELDPMGITRSKVLSGWECDRMPSKSFPLFIVITIDPSQLLHLLNMKSFSALMFDSSFARLKIAFPFSEHHEENVTCRIR